MSDPSPAVHKPVVAVWDFVSGNKNSAEDQLVHQLAELTRLRLSQTNLFQVIDEETQNAALLAQSKSTKECYDEACAVQMGKFLSAEKLVFGNLMQFGSNCTLALRLLDVEKGVVEKTAVENQSCQPELFPSLVSKLVYQLSFESGAGKESFQEAMKPPPLPPPPAQPMSKGSKFFWSGLALMALSAGAIALIADKAGEIGKPIGIAEVSVFGVGGGIVLSLYGLASD